MLSSDTLLSGIRTQSFGKKTYAFGTIDSTNSCARVLAGCWATEGTVVHAEEQTAGRGRLGRTWTATAGENLTFSIVLRPSISPDQLNLLPLLIAVGVSRGIEAFCGVRIQCKWPNDLLVHGKKCAGILLEGSMAEERVSFVVAGIGINVNQVEFPEEIRDRATSLARETGTVIDRPALFRSILEALEDEYRSASAGGYQNVLTRWRTYAPMVGRQISLRHHTTEIHGRVSGISKDGGLIVSANGNEQTYFAGDVTITDLEPYAPRD